MDKKLLINQINLLFHNMDEDKAIVASNEMMDWIEKAYNIKFNIRFEKDKSNYIDVFKVIEEI